MKADCKPILVFLAVVLAAAAFLAGLTLAAQGVAPARPAEPAPAQVCPPCAAARCPSPSAHRPYRIRCAYCKGLLTVTPPSAGDAVGEAPLETQP